MANKGKSQTEGWMDVIKSMKPRYPITKASGDFWLEAAKQTSLPVLTDAEWNVVLEALECRVHWTSEDKERNGAVAAKIKARGK